MKNLCYYVRCRYFLEKPYRLLRTLRPTYVHKLPPCNHQCPAGEDIQGWLFYAESGNYEKPGVI